MAWFETTQNIPHNMCYQSNLLFFTWEAILKKGRIFCEKNHKMATLPPPFMRKQIIKDGGGIATL